MSLPVDGIEYLLAIAGIFALGKILEFLGRNEPLEDFVIELLEADARCVSFLEVVPGPVAVVLRPSEQVKEDLPLVRPRLAGRDDVAGDQRPTAEGRRRSGGEGVG